MTSEAVEPPRVSSSYATAGGGTVLEHRYGAELLTALLLGDPVPMLGGDVTPTSVLFQATAYSPVDDLLVVGRTADGGQRRLSIGVRRAPTLAKSDTPSAHLLASYVKVVTGHWDEVRAGRWRLGLAVASPNPAVKQVKELARLARGQSDPDRFRGLIARAGATDDDVRIRLGHFDLLVRDAAALAGVTAGQIGMDELTWRVLWSLRLRELRLEGIDETDRDIADARLRQITRDKAPDAAPDVFSRLVDLTGTYAPAGSDIAEWMLRRDLSGTALAGSPTRESAWRVLGSLALQVNDHTGAQLAAGAASIELERPEALASLSDDMAQAGSAQAALLVHGDPDVGKSALTLRAGQQLASAGAAVTTLSLRDLPPTTVQFEALVGGSLAEVFGASAVGPFRLLVVDGAEAVLEGRAALLTDLAAAALRVGLGVIAVSRDDGVPAVERVLQQAATAAGSPHTMREHTVPGLTAPEIDRLVTTFPSLARLHNESRAAWLLGRPGLVDLLLRAGAEAMLPDGPLDEAQVFAVLWAELVRRGEVVEPGGPSPDARERALVCLARRDLAPGGREVPDAAALPSLRSDGLLRSPGPTVAWSHGDAFAGDLVRDLALTRLLITEGWAVLDEAPDPRRALRAARLACQARLDAAGQDTQAAFADLRTEFDLLAARHGERWAELPLEAMLTLGTARTALERAWPDLAAERHSSGLGTVLRLALQRYTRGGVGDCHVLAPLVELTFCGPHDPGREDRYGPRSLGEQIKTLVLAWLQGLIVADAAPLALRQQVRDRILAGEPDTFDEFEIEALATLGPDLDRHAEQVLTDLAEAGGGALAAAVEADAAALALSHHQPMLLITLAEAFYLPSLDARPYGWSPGRDVGIRGHEKAGGAAGPLAAWHYGPFYLLLRARPVQGMALINRMLDRATALEAIPYTPGSDTPRVPDPAPGLDLDLPGVGRRRCAGDGRAWSWYRGASAAAPPCVSALLAVELYADYLLESGISMAQTVALLLRECHNLAMPGLVAGLLLRHPEAVGDLLDPWLARPELWGMDSARASGEGRLHIQRTEAPGLRRTDRRRHSFVDLCVALVGEAVHGGDQERQRALAVIGQRLVSAGREMTEGMEPAAAAREVAVVERWATRLDAGNYRLVRHEHAITVEYQDPHDLSSTYAHLARGQEAVRLLMTYANAPGRVAPVDTLLTDLALARELAQDPPEPSMRDPRAAGAGVAAAALVAHAHGRAVVPQADLQWAADLLITLATQGPGGEMDDGWALDPRGVDRSAAVGTATLFLPRLVHLACENPDLPGALARCTSSGFDEVRVQFARAAAPLWDAPCTKSGERCAHRTVWSAVQTGLRDCRLGPYNPRAQRRLLDSLDGPYDTTLPTVATDLLLVNRLTAPILVAADAARSRSCVAPDAGRLLAVLVETHRRGADHWARKNYGEQLDRQHHEVVRVLIEEAIAGRGELLEGHVRHLSANARALTRLLRDAAIVFTYNRELRPALLAVWRLMMTAALQELESGPVPRERDRFDTAIGLLLPTPELTISDTDPDTTLEEARREWIDPDAIADLIPRWSAIARRRPDAIDDLCNLARCAAPAWQSSTGLVWMEGLIDGGFATVVGRCRRLTQWLRAVRASGHLAGDSMARWRRLVDGLAAAGSNTAAALQRNEE